MLVSWIIFGNFVFWIIFWWRSCFFLLDLVLDKCLILGSSFGGIIFWWGLCKDVIICNDV